MTTCDHDFAELTARLAHARQRPTTREQVSAAARAFHESHARFLDELDSSGSDVEHFAKLVDTMRGLYVSGLELLDLLRRHCQGSPELPGVLASVTEVVDVVARRLGPRYPLFTLRTLGTLPADAVLGKRASA